MANLNLGTTSEFFTSVSLNRARLIKIQPKVGRAVTLTTAPTAVQFEGETYVPTLATNMSAQSEAVGGGNYETQLDGVIDSDLLTNADLTRGVYRGASITEYLVDPKFPFVGALREFAYVIDEVKWNGEVFQASCSGLVTSLSKKKGQVFSRQCVVDLGGPYCRKDLSTLRRPLSGGQPVTYLDPNSRRRFRAAGFPGGSNGADYWQFGTIEYVSGANVGKFSTILTYSAQGDEFVIAEPPPFDIKLNDEIACFPGCDKTQASCKDKFDNYVNFQGNPFVRGSSSYVDGPES